MRTHSVIMKVRFTVRLRTDIKAALEELQRKRDRQFAEASIADLLMEGAILLLQKENIPLDGGGSVRPRKTPMSTTRKKKLAVA